MYRDIERRKQTTQKRVARWRANKKAAKPDPVTPMWKTVTPDVTPEQRPMNPALARANKNSKKWSKYS